MKKKASASLFCMQIPKADRGEVAKRTGVKTPRLGIWPLLDLTPVICSRGRQGFPEL